MIKIAQSFKPYIMEPGAKILIPGSTLYAQVFPSLWRIFSSSHELVNEGRVPIQGPLQRFAVFQNLNRGGVAVMTEQYKYYLSPNGCYTRSIADLPSASFYSGEYVSFGVHKHADLEKIRRRKDLKEILPFLFRHGALLQNQPNLSMEKTEVALLLDTLDVAIAEPNKERVFSLLERFVYAGLSKTLLPRLYDEEYQGIVSEDPRPGNEAVPFSLLRAAALSMRRIFIQESDGVVTLLPALPPEFPCGRWISLYLENIGEISFEWSKKTIRRVILKAHVSRELAIISPGVHSSRFRIEEQGRIISCKIKNLLEKVEIKAGTTYLWDRFCK
ncbi:hypothetical protein [Chlamydia trachomatis]|uniref:hypothetical protein n=1 Tax=Chlamydia trachomatis TaxID=813 RepID=UPI0001B5995E|nr:hypothetical protein [Chlamydia trachomatis]ADH21370.1 hypothetical protein E11023_04610 [Chlamydia trachomatis E/11023]AGT64829.1 membrane protein [Chlamydia trachomatis]AGT65759.1 membrane protein [Chlamydia trachomatis]AGT67614.1 membrane protein [Chlamydia trachomatis F/11-96]AGT69467.1 membrane protein [Chlamydia trachomatis]